MGVDRLNPGKLYIQLKHDFRERIRRGEWEAGSRIPTESELCGLFGVSKITVRQAVGGLVDEGLLKRVHGKGTFVVPDGPHLARIPSLAVKTRLTDDLAGHEVLFQVLVVDRKLADHRAKWFEADEGEIVEIKRLRVIDKEPVLVETTQVSDNLCPGIADADLSEDSIYGVLVDRSKVEIARVDKTFEIGRLSESEARDLQGSKGERALVVHRFLFSSAGRLIAYTRSVTVSERFKFQMVYERI